MSELILPDLLRDANFSFVSGLHELVLPAGELNTVYDGLFDIRSLENPLRHILKLNLGLRDV